MRVEVLPEIAKDSTEMVPWFALGAAGRDARSAVRLNDPTGPSSCSRPVFIRKQCQTFDASNLTQSNNFIHRRHRRTCRDLLLDIVSIFDLQKQPLLDRRLFHLLLISHINQFDFVNRRVLRSGIRAISVLTLIGFEQ